LFKFLGHHLPLVIQSFQIKFNKQNIQNQIQSYLHLYSQINHQMILFFWYVSFVLSNFFSLLLSYVFDVKGFFFLLIDKFTYRVIFSCLIRTTQYNTFSFIPFVSLFHSVDKTIQQNLFHFDD